MQAEKYFFVSCSAEDSEKVFEILGRLQAEGFKFYCDTEKISNCAGVIAFHSQSSKKSERCKEEIFLARHEKFNKSFISVYLDEVELSLGIKMTLIRFPSIKFYEYTDKENFYSDLKNKINETFSLTGQAGSFLDKIPPVAVAGGIALGGVIFNEEDKPKDKKNWFSSLLSKFINILPAESADDEDLKPEPVESPAPKISRAELELKMETDLKPYEGAEPFVFISYSHKDVENVFNILSELKKSGLRFWYDKGIEHGASWLDCIAEHIQNCASVIAFHSQNSKYSEHCKDEISFARDRENNKKIISIYLENVNLSPGIKLAVHRFQAINFYEYPAAEKNNFYSKLTATKLLKPCFSVKEV